MSYQNQSFGMMDPGYFVPRGEILTWLNDLLKLNLTKIEQLGSGAVYCQLVDVIHPDKVALNKVNWKAKNDYEFINNLKVLQNAFDKIGIKRHVEVEKLAKAKYQDNLEFIQWIKRYYDLNCGERGNNYDAQKRRGNAPVDLSFADKSVVPKTYNGSGTVNNDSKVIEKVQKKKPVAPIAPPKIEQKPITSVKSPRVESKPQPIKKQTTKIAKPVKTQQPAKIEQTASSNTQTQKQVHKEVIRQVVIEYQTDPKLEAQLEKAFADLQQAKAESQAHQERAKNAEMKMQMIKQIMQSQDDPALKIGMMEQILKQ